MTNISKLLNYLLYLLVALTAVFTIMYFAGGYVEGAAYDTPVNTDIFINWAKLLVYIAAGATIIFEVVNLVLHPKNAVRSLISIGILAVLILISYGLADDTPLQLAGYTGSDNVPSRLVFSDTILYAMYFLFGGAIVAILYAEISKLFK